MVSLWQCLVFPLFLNLLSWLVSPSLFLLLSFLSNSRAFIQTFDKFAAARFEHFRKVVYVCSGKRFLWRLALCHALFTWVLFEYSLAISLSQLSLHFLYSLWFPLVSPLLPTCARLFVSVCRAFFRYLHHSPFFIGSFPPPQTAPDEGQLRKEEDSYLSFLPFLSLFLYLSLSLSLSLSLWIVGKQLRTESLGKSASPGVHTPPHVRSKTFEKGFLLSLSSLFLSLSSLSLSLSLSLWIFAFSLPKRNSRPLSTHRRIIFSRSS